MEMNDETKAAIEEFRRRISGPLANRVLDWIDGERGRLSNDAQQGLANERALHDALLWAHEWHLRELPSPTRVTQAAIERIEQLRGERDELREHTLSLERQVGDLRKMYEKAEADLERERMRLAACGVVARANLPATAKTAREMHPDYRSASCDDVARAVDREMALRARVAELEAFGRKVSAIRDSIVGAQSFNWSEHAYPLVAALGEAGFEGVGYQIARENLGTLIDRAERAEAQVAAARTFIEDDTCRHDEEKRAVLRAMDEAAK